MDINELESYKRSDAVKFHTELNPKLWEKEKLSDEVRLRLLDMAEDFREFLGIEDLQVKDITISGSNAAYNYTPTSDIDLHLVVDVPKLKDEVYRELFNAKKYQYNDQHNYRIGDHEVELYVQPSGDEHHSQGIYSVQDEKWLRVPSRKKPSIDDSSVKHKYRDLGTRIEKAVKRQDLTDIEALYDKLVNMRKAGLETTGEFGVENLVFKLLRKHGLIDQLRNTRNDIKDKELSLNEKRKKKKKTSYGKFNGAFFPGYGYYGNGASSSDVGVADGGSDGGESVKESEQKHDIAETIGLFLKFCCEQLGIQDCPRIRLKRDPEWSKRNQTFGRFDPDANLIVVSIANRHPVDSMRTIAHELIHYAQDQNQEMPPGAGATGSDYENEANAGAGIIMRNFAQKYPQHFTLEESSGYIPVNAKQAKDPRYSMAMTQDIKPGETQRQAAKMGFKTDPAGKPPLLHKSAAKNTSPNKAYNIGLTENWATTSVNKVLHQKMYKMAADILADIWERKQKLKKHDIGYYAAQVARQFPNDLVDARALVAMVQGEQLDEIWGFAAGKSVPAWKRGKIKKKKEKFEPSAYDKLVARRQAAAKGDKEAFRKSFKDIAKDPAVAESWSEKYKRSIDCNNPKGFSQRAHCAGRKKNESISEGYRLQLERGSDMDVLHITDTKTGHRTEVRGKPNYETAYDANDQLHQLLDRIGKAANISDLINGEPVGINPRHPDGASAKAHTDTAFGEDDEQYRNMRRLLVTPEHPLGKYLYHLTGADGLLGMLKDGHLGDHDEYFSMTADPKYDVGGGSGWTKVNIIIDTAKVKKLETFEKHMENWEWGDHGSGNWAKQPGQDWESEYRVEEIIPLNAVVAVKILKSAVTPEIIKLAKQRNIKLLIKDTSVQENLAEQKAHDAIFQEILVDLLQKKYPDAEFDYQGDKVISADGKLTVIADLQVEDGYGGVWVWDVDTGPYKGVLGTAIKQATAELLRQQPDLKPALFVDGDNQNPEAWQAIANKLNYTLLDENFADGKKK